MRTPIRWVPRGIPLVASGMVVEGSPARALALRLARDPEALAPLRCLAGPNVLCVLGQDADLPWIDGATFVAPDPECESLWTPCYQRTEVAPRLVADALAPQLGTRPFVVIPQRSLAFSLVHARATQPELLKHWAAHPPEAAP